ncbi:hypothetical protein [Pseudomonas phage vB_Pae-PA152]|nr:hypothetical protein [Pseudomonas phage vB_Pae-PA152]
MTLNTTDLITTCRERGYAELDPHQGKHFVGFWAPDLANQGIGQGVAFSTWQPHPASTNRERTLVSVAEDRRLTTSNTNQYWVYNLNTKAAMQVASASGVPMASPTLSWTVPGQTKMYLRFKLWSNGSNYQKVFCTAGDGWTGMYLHQSGNNWILTWTEVGGASKTLTVNHGSSGWTWVKILADTESKTIEMQFWDRDMRTMYTTGTAEFKGIEPAPSLESVRHTVGWFDLNVPGEIAPGSFELVDFGYGNDFNMPPEPGETREES